MSFDARSKERLAALGRTLPQKLPPPEPPATPKGAEPTRPLPRQGPADSARHHLEREQDPAALFRALMQASPDGSVPPHLLDRLRELEGSRRPVVAETPPVDPSPRTPSQSAKGAPMAGKRRGGRMPSRGTEDQDLYTAFAQLLLEDEGDP
ncbi:MAG: hypothetical protein VKP70_01750 [Cyanobacteriota bacterium]|nr:hypothetical protein [Cyanobacteriota bacterium]